MIRTEPTEPPAQLYVLVHAKSADFEWSRITLKALRRQARKQGLELRLLHDWREAVQLPELRALPVLGVDSEWLDEVLQELPAADRRVILLDGVVRRPQPNISSVLFDQAVLVDDQLALLRARGRTRTAFFGAQKNDTSDASKADAFVRAISADAVYRITDSADHCFADFYAHIDRYDSVICANDLIAAYLLGRCRELGIRIPEQLYLLGNCDLWISRHVTPALTTAAYHTEMRAAVTLQLFKNLAEFPDLDHADMFLRAEILDRASTGGAPLCEAKESPDSSTPPTDAFAGEGELCPELQQIRVLDQVLSACSPTALSILQRLVDGESYDAIARELFLSVNTVKYHIKKLYRLLDIRHRQELVQLTQKYGLRLI